MTDDVLHPPATPLSWRDIEALPFMVLGILAIAAVLFALLDTGPVLQATTAKAAGIAALVAVRHVFLEMEDAPKR